MRLGERLWDAYLLTLGFLLLELGGVALLFRGELASSAELLFALRGLGPIAAVCAAPAAAVAGGIIEGIARSERLRPRLLVALAAGAFGFAVGFGVASGRRFDGVGRPLFALAIGALGGALAWLAPHVPRGLRRLEPKRRAAVVVAVALVGVLATEVVNRTVLPRLYPTFHLGLVGLTFLFIASSTLAYGPLGSERSRSPAQRAGSWRAISALLVFAASAGLVPSSADRVALADNVRLVYLDHAPVLGRVVEVAALIEPPEPLELIALEGPAGPSGTLDLESWDILLVTVDALRADHVGAYGYDRPLTPEIDALAREGVTFEAAYTATPHTSYAVSSLMTGKYMRPLLAMDIGHDSETWADHLRRYGYSTAAFYPPAVFFIDESRFASFSDRNLGFEYAKVEFLSAAERTAQLDAYLSSVGQGTRAFAWVHLFEPHEPYEAHSGRDFGARDIDRYDAEIAEADAAIGALVRAARARRPRTMVIVTADHGEEFGEHGGRYHGTTVYEEQVRVPLVISAPGLLPVHRVKAPVGLVDLLPTVLAGLHVPMPARVRGRDLGALMTGASDGGAGFAFAETDEMSMLARGALRLVCARRAGACALYDLENDARQVRDAKNRKPSEHQAMRAALRSLDGSHGRYEREGLSHDGKVLPEPIRRGVGGDGEAAPEIAALLDDADVIIRRKAAEVLFDLRRKEVAPQLRLALGREEDPEARAYIALALTRLGEGAPLAFELVTGADPALRRLSALALAESGDGRGHDVLVAWLFAAFPKDGRPERADELTFERARELLDAVAALKSKEAVAPLLTALGDVRLRPHVARALARIGQDGARPSLATRLMEERYVPSRIAITEALLDLGGGPELREPLVSMLGMPDPLPHGLAYAERADLLRFVGGPTRDGELRRLQRFATSGVAVDFVVPELVKGAVPPPGAKAEVRAICGARARRGGEIRLGRRLDFPSGPEKKAPIPSDQPSLDPTRTVSLRLPETVDFVEVAVDLPEALGARPGKQITLVVYATQDVEVHACALLPLRAELPSPPPKPWKPGG